MIRIHSWVGVFTLAALGAAACGDDAFLDPEALGGSGGSAGGRGGNAGVAGNAGTGGSSAGTGGSAAGTGGGPTGAGAGGSAGSSGSAGGNPTTPDAGALDAGDSDASVSVPAQGDAGACALEAITAVPYSEPWQTTNGASDVLALAGCQQCDNTDDHIVTFTAPGTGIYRFFASSGGDVELAVYPGDCTTVPDDVSCGEDIDFGNQDYDDQVDVQINHGDTVTVVVGESCEELGGAGTLTIGIAP